MFHVNHLWARLSYPENLYITKFVVCCLLQFLLKLEGLIVFFLDGDDKISPAFIIGPVKPVDFFFKINFIKYEYNQSVKRFGSRSRPTRSSYGSKLFAKVISRQQKLPLPRKDLST